MTRTHQSGHEESSRTRRRNRRHERASQPLTSPWVMKARSSLMAQITLDHVHKAYAGGVKALA